MKIVVLGATGTTGRLVMHEALARGYEVVAFVRRPQALDMQQNLTIVSGSVEDEQAMRNCFSGADAVISCLGERPGLRVFCRGSDFQRRTLPKIVSAIDEAGVNRFVLMSSFGSGETAKKAGVFLRVFLYSLIAKKLFDDKACAEASLAQCQTNWTAVYPVTLTERPALPSADLVPLDDVRQVPGVPLLPFANVARCLVDLAPDTHRHGQKLLLTTPGGWQ